MLLVVKLNFNELKTYRDDFIKCLHHNSNNIYIKDIFIFLDIIDNTLPNFKKVKYIVKPDYSKEDIIEYSKKISKSEYIILSEPFVKIRSLLKYKNIDIIDNKNYTIFNRRLKPDFNTNRKKSIKQQEIKKVSIDNKKIFKEKGASKLDVIIVSVNYNDYLSITLEENTKIFDNITVVTSEDDIECQEICNNYNVNYIICEDIVRNGVINKSLGINKGIKSIEYPDWILVLDADIIVEDRIDIDKLNKGVLYTSSRWIIEDIKEYNHYKIGDKDLSEFKFETNKGIGFFQLFNFSKKQSYPDSDWGRYSDSTWSDIIFKKGFKNNESVNINVIHLGKPYQKWQNKISEKKSNKKKILKTTSKVITTVPFVGEVEEKILNKKIVVYTCISANYDKLKEVNIKENNIDYICFSDQFLQSDTWKIRKIPEYLNSLNNTKKARCIKILPHLFLSEYDISVWIDGSIEVIGYINELINDKLKTNFTIPKHPDRVCVYQEALKVIEMNKDGKEIVNKQIEEYMKLDYPKNFGLVQSNVIIRNHNSENVIRFSEFWWSQLLKYSKRDQLSFNFSLWKENIKINIMEPSIISSRYFQIWTHIDKGNRKAKVRNGYDDIKNYINGEEI